MLQTCPKCGKDQGAPAEECRSCGVVFAKYHPPETRAASGVQTVALPDVPPPKTKQRTLLKVLLALVVGSVLLCGAGFLGIFKFARGTEAYAAASEMTTTHPILVRALGEPIEIDRFFVFVMYEDLGGDKEGEASFVFPTTGPKGSTSVVISAEKRDGVWAVLNAYHGPKGASREVLVQDGRLVGGDIEDAPAQPDAPVGLTADELLSSGVETFGVTPSVAPDARTEPIAPAAGPRARHAASQEPASARRACPYPGSTNSSVSTMRPADMRSEVRRSAGCLTLVVIWGAWCPTCRKHYPYLAELADRYRDEGLAVHSFSTDQDPAALEEFLGAQRKRTGTFRLQLDPNKKGSIKAGAREFGAEYTNSVPFYALFDENNRVVVQGAGAVFEKLDPEIRSRLR